MGKKIELTRDEQSMLRYSIEEAAQMSLTAKAWCEAAHKKASKIIRGLRKIKKEKGLTIGIEENDAYVITNAETLSAMAAVGMIVLWRGVPPAYVVGF